jgi:hypothetical protein
MPRIRIAAAGAIASLVLFVSGIAATSALAQSATGETPGKPLQLLKIVEGPSPASRPHHMAAAKPSHHARLAFRPRARLHHMMARAIPPHAPAQATDAPPPAPAWPQANSSPQADVAAADPPPPPTAATPDQTPSQIVVAGQTVQVASPNDVNEMDLAANDSAAKNADAQTNDAAPDAVPANPSLAREAADPAPSGDSQKAEAVQPAHAEVGSTSWILQVMAALGGAVTAGSLAWFLIGSTPQRTYG